MQVSHLKSVTVADFTGTVTAFNSQGSTTTVAASDLARPSDWNSAHQFVMSLGGNTSNSSVVAGTNLMFAGAGGVTVIGSTSNNGGATVSLSGPSTDLGALTNYEQLIGTNVRPFAQQTSVSLGQNTLYVCPVILERPLSAVALKLPAMITHSSSAVSSGQKGLTLSVGAYSRLATNATDTGYTRLTQIWSTTHTMAASYSSNVSFAHSAISAIGNSTSYNTYSSSSAGLNVSSILHGPREIIFPVSSTFPAGEYWMGVIQSTSSAGTVGNILNVSNVVATWQTFNRIGVATNASENGMLRELMVGSYSATTGALPVTINQTQIRQSGMMILGFIGQNTQ